MFPYLSLLKNLDKFEELKDQNRRVFTDNVNNPLFYIGNGEKLVLRRNIKRLS